MDSHTFCVVADLEWLPSASGTAEGELQPAGAQTLRAVTWQSERLEIRELIPNTGIYVSNEAEIFPPA